MASDVSALIMLIIEKKFDVLDSRCEAHDDPCPASARSFCTVLRDGSRYNR